MNIFRRNIPNLITCFNALSGCVAIVMAFRPYEQIGTFYGWQWAALAIGIAAVADFLDGFTARLIKAWSALGRELDSLSDLVSFGVAPAMLILNLLAATPGSPAWLPWIALLIPIAGALRLARFNVDTRQTTSFIGLPIPANAIFWIGYAALINYYPDWQWLSATWLILPLIIIEAWLMIGNFPLFSLKFHDYAWRGNEPRWLLILGSLVLILFLGLPGLALIVPWYLVLALVNSLFHKK